MLPGVIGGNMSDYSTPTALFFGELGNLRAQPLLRWPYSVTRLHSDSTWRVTVWEYTSFEKSLGPGLAGSFSFSYRHVIA